MKSLTEITLYELMAEDFSVYVRQGKEQRFDIEIENDYGKNVVEEQGIHPFAADAFASFCRQYLAGYERATNQGATND
jgi:hypothetical protein